MVVRWMMMMILFEFGWRHCASVVVRDWIRAETKAGVGKRFEAGAVFAFGQSVWSMQRR
jgi:hypothetical protein